ncbi:hypothetical protein [Pseudonocardia lacus]|uniref:hypothetical protein n=1 Tax=Pseudonocardia lacus TaxID=2835865 RepID=UPI001BDCFC61|nr:hypothetical protein [Pseudonocardia lacus]
MTSTQLPAGHLPPPVEPIPPRRRRRTALVVGTGAVLVGGITAGAIALGVTVSTSLQRETTAQSVAGVREVVVEFDEGSVRLTAATGPDVDVRTTRAWTPGYQPVLGQRLVDGVLTLTSDCADFNIGCEVGREIAVPAGTEVRVRGAAGPVEAVDLDVPRFSVDSAAGPVSVDFATAPEAVRVATVAGPVTVRVPRGAYRVSADVLIGQVDVGVDNDPGADRSIEVSTVTGSIDVLAR